MKSEYKIGIYLRSYAVDKPYNWEQRELRSIERSSAYRIEYFVSLFLTVIDNKYTLVYKIQQYNFQLLDVIKRYSKGLYILELNPSSKSVISFEQLDKIIFGSSNELNFNNIRIQKVKSSNDCFSFRSMFHRNIELKIQEGTSITRFSLIEQRWVEYVYEIANYEAFAQNIKEKFHNYIKAFNDTYNQIQSFDLQDILKDLQVEIDEIFINKVGGDDRYYVDEIRTISYPEDRLDDYIKEYIKIGRRNIYKDSGYTSAYKMALKDLKTGVMSVEDVSLLRKKLISEYSAETHTFAKIDSLLRQYESYLAIPRLHRNDSGIDSYLMSSSFITSLEQVIGGGSYIVNWDNIEALIEKANNHIIKLMWWKD